MNAFVQEPPHDRRRCGSGMTEHFRLPAHRIAVEAATTLVSRCDALDMPWKDMAIACETVLAIVVSCCAEMSDFPDKERFSTEIIEAMTEQAHKRVIALLRGVPYEL